MNEPKFKWRWIRVDEVDEFHETIEKLKKVKGIKLKFKGEREQKRAMQTEMVLASVLEIILIFISILYLFNSIRASMIVMSVIHFSLLGVYAVHFIMGLIILIIAFCSCYIPDRRAVLQCSILHID